MQKEIQKEKMMAQEQGLGEDLNFLDNPNGDVQLIEAPKLDQPKFMAPTKEGQGIIANPTIPSWLSNPVSKKQNLHPVSIVVKDIVTKYAAHTSKSKKLQSNAHLIKDLVIGKIIVEVTTYKQKKESREIDVEGFQVTIVDLGAITKDTGNHFFKLSTNHMLS